MFLNILLSLINHSNKIVNLNTSLNDKINNKIENLNTCLNNKKKRIWVLFNIKFKKNCFKKNFVLKRQFKIN